MILSEFLVYKKYALIEGNMNMFVLGAVLCTNKNMNHFINISATFLTFVFEMIKTNN